MGQNHSTTCIVLEDSIPPNESKTYMIDTNGADRINVFTKYGWEVVSGTVSGIDISLTYGMDLEGVENNILVAENSDDVPGLTQPTLGNTNEFHVYEFNIAIDVLPRYVFMTVTNQDDTNEMAFDSWADR